MEYLATTALHQLPFYQDIEPYITQLRPLIAPLLPILNATLYSTSSIALPLLRTIYSLVAHLSADQNPVVTIVATLAAFWLSLRVLGFVKRQVFYWLGMVLQMALWGVVAVVGLLVWSVGPEKCVKMGMDVLGGWIGHVEQGKEESRRETMGNTDGRTSWR